MASAHDYSCQTSKKESFGSSEIAFPTMVSPRPDMKLATLTMLADAELGYIWNYGAFPQTWEDPQVKHPETGANGDNDPLDVCEIGEALGYVGQVKQVKVLGIMALLDEGETDWKVLVVDVNDPLAPRLNDIEDVERHLPGLIRATNEWFRIYKIPDGKPEVCLGNTFELRVDAIGCDRTSLRSAVKQSRRSMPWRSFTSATRHGVSSSWVNQPPRPRRTTSPCEYSSLL